MIFRKDKAADLRARIVPLLPGVWRFALSLSGRPDIADDLTQDTCLRALERAHQWRENQALAGWLLIICRSIWLNEVRAQTVRKTGGMTSAKAHDLVDQTVGPETRLFANQVFARVMELPEAQRATVMLVYVQQFTYSEAAEILGIPIGTVMSRLSTARAALATLNDTQLPGAKAKPR
ncbi:MAG: RNA polymerase sigma factor [Pseudomonadota bacterium]